MQTFFSRLRFFVIDEKFDYLYRAEKRKVLKPIKK